MTNSAPLSQSRLPTPPADVHPALSDLPAARSPATPARFQTGDRVMVPPYGLGTICETCERQGREGAATYYAVEFQGSTSRAFVPVNAPAGSGIRAALTGRDLTALLRQLTEGTTELPRQWSARQRRVLELLSGGDPFELATLTCELRRWNVQRGLPDLDRQAFRRAIRLLEQEVRDLPGDEARQVRELLETAWNENPA